MATGIKYTAQKPNRMKNPALKKYLVFCFYQDKTWWDRGVQAFSHEEAGKLAHRLEHEFEFIDPNPDESCEPCHYVIYELDRPANYLYYAWAGMGTDKDGFFLLIKT